MTKTIYTSAFYSTYASDSISSAEEILTVVKDIVQPASVVDVGCGIGTWLKVWKDWGVKEIAGIDGDYVDREKLLFPRDRFEAMDLTSPLASGVKFDLVQSLEVAEHLPAESAEAFVSFLCRLGPIVLFSAAIPYQGGTDHINEQWPEYWAELFNSHGYVTVDAIRDRVWGNPRVAYYYAQNSLLFVHSDHIERLGLQSWKEAPQTATALSRVHPRAWLEIQENAPKLERIAQVLPRSSYDFASRSFRKLGALIK